MARLDWRIRLMDVPGAQPPRRCVGLGPVGKENRVYRRPESDTSQSAGQRAEQKPASGNVCVQTSLPNRLSRLTLGVTRVFFVGSAWSSAIALPAAVCAGTLCAVFCGGIRRKGPVGHRSRPEETTRTAPGSGTSYATDASSLRHFARGYTVASRGEREPESAPHSSYLENAAD